MTAFIDSHRGRFGVEPICRTLEVSASAYYHRASGARSDRVIGDERLLERTGEVHAANYYAYGYRRTWKALLRAGEQVGRDRVKRLMRNHQIQGAKRRGKPSGGPRSAIRQRPAARTWSTAISLPVGPTRSGSPTSPTCAAGKASCSSGSSSTRSAGGSSAGSSPATCAPISSSTHYAWHSLVARPAPTSS